MSLGSSSFDRKKTRPSKGGFFNTLDLPHCISRLFLREPELGANLGLYIHLF